MFQVLSTLDGGTTGVSETQNQLTFREVPSAGERLNHTYQFIATAVSKSWAGLEIGLKFGQKSCKRGQNPSKG